MKRTRNKVADQTEKKNAFPYANGKYLGNGIRLKTFSQMEGIAYTREETFEQAVMKGKDLPILCDSCQNSDKKKFICKHYKIDKKKFNELQGIERCPKFKEII